MTRRLPTLRQRLLTGLAALAVLGIAGATASAVEPVAEDQNPGAIAPAGTFRDANGDLWISDRAGICRVNEGSHEPDAGLYGDVPPGPIYCDPPDAFDRIGPVEPSQSAWDLTTGTLYVGDRDSNSGGVWRFRFDQNQDPAVITSAHKIIDLSGVFVRDRVVGMSYDRPRDVLDFSTKNAPTILRVAGPGECPEFTQPAACATLTMGTANDKDAPSLVHDAAGNLYVADTAGVTRIQVGSGDPNARPVPGLNLGSYSALAYDPYHAGGMLYAGTTNSEGVDWIDALQITTGDTSTYSVGFEGVTAIGVRNGAGDLDVFDDPGVKHIGEDVQRSARRFMVPFEEFAAPPRIIEAPQPIISGRTATFAYTYPVATDFFCSLDLAPPTPCGVNVWQGVRTYTGLTHGVHTFQLFAKNGVTGPRTIRRFTVDTRAPIVQIDGAAIAGQNAEFHFSADDLNVDFTCRLDDGSPGVCDSPTRYAGLPNGLHTFSVAATDFVGNTGPTVAHTFRIGPEPVPYTWKPGKVVATLNGRRLRVTFTAPPGARFASFILSKRGVYPVRTKPMSIRPGHRNTTTVTLTLAQARRLQAKGITVRVVAGAVKRTQATKSGWTHLKITRSLATGRR